MKRVLVAYFSWSNVTKRIATSIASSYGADLFEIVTEHHYSRDYFECVEESKIEKADDVRPALVGKQPSVDGYERIIVGFPCWCGTCPMAVMTFLEQYDLAGKEVIPFMTHGGSGVTGGNPDMKRACPGADVRVCADGNRLTSDLVTSWFSD